MTHGFMVVYDDDDRVAVHGGSLQYDDVKKNRADAVAGKISPLDSWGAGGWAKRMERVSRALQSRWYPAGRRN
jgi:hypothetical protein